MWNTGTKIVANGFRHSIRLVDQEDPSRQIVVPARTARMWDDTIVPWCNDDAEVGKSFLVSNVETGGAILVVFQRFDNDTIHFFSYSDPGIGTAFLPYSESKQIFSSMSGNDRLAPQSRIDLFMHDSAAESGTSTHKLTRVWGMPAGLTESAAQKILDEAAAFWGV